LYWAWNSNPTETYYDIVADYTKGYTTDDDLTIQGKYMVQQFKDNAKEAKSFLTTSALLPEMELKPSIILYPNPLTTNILNIEYGNMEREDYNQIQIKNINGQTVKSIQVDDKLPCQINLEGIIPGTYFISFISDVNSYTSKLVITN